MVETTSPEYAYDVFISYSSKDKAWVRDELLKRIEEAGLRAFIDFRDFKPGIPVLDEMQRGLTDCRKTLLILTSNYAESGWGKLENQVRQWLDADGQEFRLIPLLKTDCEVPPRIKYLTPVDFTDEAGLDLAWRQLLTALGAPPEPPPVEEPKREGWCLAHPYAMPPNFTGRVDERKMLSGWLNGDARPLLVLRALGGFGKSALVWHWLMQDVPPAKWPRVVWWSFYDNDNFESFVAETLKYLRIRGADTLKPREQAETLLGALHNSGTLLVLDGFERALRAFGGLNAAYQGDEEAPTADNGRDCISELAAAFLRAVATLPEIRSKVLLTTRLCPRAVENHGELLTGCRAEELLQMQSADAVAFFRAQGIRGGRAEIEAACAPYGYHPLSLSLLAGWISHDLQQPGDIAAARRLDVTGDLVQRQHHVLQQSYDSLNPARRNLLGRIACFRGPVNYHALRALAETEITAETQRRGEPESQKVSSQRLSVSAVNFDADVHDLVARGLLHHDRAAGRFDLHPIVRRYAYNRLTAPDRAAAHSQLRDYFAAVETPNKVTTLDDLAPVIELYHHTVRAGQFDEACDLFYGRLSKALYYRLGAYQLRIDLLRALFPDGEDRPPRLKDESDQAWTLNELANSYGQSGQPRRAVPLFEQVSESSEKRGDKNNLAISLGNLAQQQMPVGALQAAESNLRRCIALCWEIQEKFDEAVGHRELGWLLAYRGAWAESEAELTTALMIFEKESIAQSQGVVWVYLALRALLMLRSSPSLISPLSSLAAARRALELVDEDARINGPLERDYIRAHWLLGAAQRVNGAGDEAERHLHEALQRCRRINAVSDEADILIDLARLRAEQDKADEAQRLAEEALIITERSEYVLQGADAHLVFAQLALSRGDNSAARHHASEAKRLATCDGPPDYTYKVAYDEAIALLAKL